jgi:hypothetical protein
MHYDWTGDICSYLHAKTKIISLFNYIIKRRRLRTKECIAPERERGGEGERERERERIKKLCNVM